MRACAGFLLGLMLVTAVQAQEAKKLAKRYGIEVDTNNYPQATPKDAVESALKAIERKRIDYLVAQLADPDFVDRRVKDLGGKFEELVKETAGPLVDDPESAKMLRRYLAEGEWETDDTTASARLKNVKERVYLRKLENRWFLENRKGPEDKK